MATAKNHGLRDIFQGPGTRVGAVGHVPETMIHCSDHIYANSV